MATLVPQTDTGVRDANSYVSINEADEYLLCRDRTNENGWGGSTTLQKTAALIKARDFIDKVFEFKGEKLQSIEDYYQVLEFPRKDLFDFNGVLIVGIPRKVKDAAIELAVRARTKPLLRDHVATLAGGADETADTSYTSTIVAGTEKSRQAGSLRREFFAPGTRTGHSVFHVDYSRTSDHFVQDPYPAVSFLLREYVKQTAGEIAANESYFIGTGRAIG